MAQLHDEAEVIRIHQRGGPEVLRPERIALAPPGSGEVRITQTAIGVNYMDVYQRTGLHPAALPAVLGLEAVGVVEALGPGVREVEFGERVAYAGVPGAYATRRNVPADRLLRVPPGLDDAVVAGSLFKGLTAELLVRRVARLEPGDTLLLHAAAGGVGRLVTQWALRLGAEVLGLVSSPAKAEVARAAGCTDVVVQKDGRFVDEVRKRHPGGVRVVFDASGTTLLESLRCLAPRGLLVVYGQADGPFPPLDPGELLAHGSLSVSAPSIRDFIRQRRELEPAAAAVFTGLAEGWLRPRVERTFPLAEAAAAHRALESRRTSGALVLWPG